MAPSIPERDWKMMKKVKDDLLNCLCERINRQSMAVLEGEGDSEHEKFLKLVTHVRDTNRIVADCFDDWRRSTLFIKLANLQHQGLLTSEQLERLSVDTQLKLKGLLSFGKRESKPPIERI